MAFTQCVPLNDGGRPVIPTPVDHRQDIELHSINADERHTRRYPSGYLDTTTRRERRKSPVLMQIYEGLYFERGFIWLPSPSHSLNPTTHHDRHNRISTVDEHAEPGTLLCSGCSPSEYTRLASHSFFAIATCSPPHRSSFHKRE